MTRSGYTKTRGYSANFYVSISLFGRKTMHFGHAGRTQYEWK